MPHGGCALGGDPDRRRRLLGLEALRVPRSTTGVATVVGVDQRFTGNGDGSQHLDFDVAGYTEIEQALPNVDAVVIATPPSTHAQLSMQAIEAGKHVLVEKPLATTTTEAQLVSPAQGLTAGRT